MPSNIVRADWESFEVDGMKALLLYLMGMQIYIASLGASAATIIDEDTFWSGTILLTDEVQIAPGVILELLPGTEVSATEQGSLKVFGHLKAIGSELDFVRFDNVRIVAKDGHFIDFKYVHMIAGELLAATGNSSLGSFRLERSVFERTHGWYIWYPVGSENLINQSVFDGISSLTLGLDIGVDSRRGDKVSIQNSLFLGQGVTNWANYGEEGLVLRKNTFLGSTSYDVGLRPGYSSAYVDAAENYWGVVGKNRISNRIFDRKDDLDNASEITFEPYLLDPDSMTPKLIDVGNVKNLEGCRVSGARGVMTAIFFTMKIMSAETKKPPMRFCSDEVLYLRY